MGSWVLFVVAVNMLTDMPMGPAQKLPVQTYEECSQLAGSISQQQMQAVREKRSTAIYLFACAEKSVPDEPA